MNCTLRNFLLKLSVKLQVDWINFVGLSPTITLFYIYVIMIKIILILKEAINNMIKIDYSPSTNFSGRITPFTKENLLKRAQNPEVTTKLKNKFKEIENSTDKNSVIHLFRQSDDLFNFALISRNDRYSVTKGFKISNLVESFLGITIESIKKIEKFLIKHNEL